jgi:hypothetical protein
VRLQVISLFGFFAVQAVTAATAVDRLISAYTLIL